MGLAALNDFAVDELGERRPRPRRRRLRRCFLCRTVVDNRTHRKGRLYHGGLYHDDCRSRVEKHLALVNGAFEKAMNCAE